VFVVQTVVAEAAPL